MFKSELIKEEEFRLFQRYFKARDKGLLKEEITCTCGSNLYLEVSKTTSVWKPSLKCYACGSAFIPGLALRAAASNALLEIESF